MAIHLPPDLERQAQEEAEHEGMDIDAFVTAAVAEKLSRSLAKKCAAARPNEGMLKALKRAREIQKEMPMTSGDSVAILREGRAGPIYGLEPIE
jgi:hypothetical protein